MVALRVYADLLDRPAIDTLGQPYEIAVIGAAQHKTEILAVCRNVIVAKAAFTAGVEQRRGKRMKLTRGGPGPCGQRREAKRIDPNLPLLTLEQPLRIFGSSLFVRRGFR
jgi:hypothetical protein